MLYHLLINSSSISDESFIADDLPLISWRSVLVIFIDNYQFYYPLIE
jgi:hypothetical protein